MQFQLETNTVAYRLSVCKGMGYEVWVGCSYTSFNHPNFIYLSIILNHPAFNPTNLSSFLLFPGLVLFQALLAGVSSPWVQPSCRCVHVCFRLQFFFLHWLKPQSSPICFLSSRMNECILVEFWQEVEENDCPQFVLYRVGNS